MNRTISDAAKPSQAQAQQTIESSTEALTDSANMAATKPTEAQSASGAPVSSAASSTAGANTDPNAPRA
ncbi:MAG TPA: hypothetical protein VJR29_12055 [bacterium]|nr:hypothetical protein [bacterium]